MQKRWIICFVFLSAWLSLSGCEESLQSMRVGIRNMEGKGVGYNQGYSTLDGFFAPSQPWSETWVPFLDLRAHIFNDGEPAANAGVGVRYLASRVWGGNLYYDYRKTSHQHYNQVSFGLESLGTTWDVRLNGYFPVGDKKSSQLGRAKFIKFTQHHMRISSRYEFAMTGANAEVGTHITHFKHVPLYFAAGPYYLTGQCKIAWGGEARVSLDIFDYVKLEGMTAYDAVFRWTGQAQFGITIPLGAKKKVKTRPGYSCSTMSLLRERSIQRVDRNEIIPVSKIRKKSTAINPLTGEPYFFWFVDNTSHSLGTFESPFPTLADAQNASLASDVIYVFPGDGTSSGMDMGINLKDNQRLLGAGQTQPLPTTLGTVTIPSLANRASGVPLMTNAAISGGGDVVVCRNNNQVSGFNLQNVNPASSSSACINVTGSSATITHNTLTAFSSSKAISFLGNTTHFGTVAILNNTILGGDTSDTFGIAINTLNSASGTFTIQDNLFSGTSSAAGLDQGITILNPNTTSNETLTVSILNNTFNSQTNSAINFPADPPAAIYCEMGSGATQATTLFIHGNSITIPSGIASPLAGIYVLQSNTALSTALLKITNNVSETPVGIPGYQFIPNANNTSLMQFYFTHNIGTIVGP